MKLEAKQRLSLTAAPQYTKLLQLGTDIAEKDFDADVNNGKIKLIVQRAQMQAVRDIGSSAANSAEKFLQNDASSGTWRQAMDAYSSHGPVNDFTEAFSINFEEMY